MRLPRRPQAEGTVNDRSCVLIWLLNLNVFCREKHLLERCPKIMDK